MPTVISRMIGLEMAAAGVGFSFDATKFSLDRAAKASCSRRPWRIQERRKLLQKRVAMRRYPDGSGPVAHAVEVNNGMQRSQFSTVYG